MSSSTPSRFSFPAVCLRLWLAVLLWQVPVPWGHEHCSGVSESIEHMVRFHPGDVQKWQQGWHWHWSFPDQVPGNSGRPETPLPGAVATGTNLLSTGDESPEDVSANVFAGRAAFLPHPRATYSALFATESASADRSVAGFLMSYCPSHSPQQVLCRRSC